MWENLKILSSFPNRCASTLLGQQAEEWIRTQLTEMAKQYGSENIVSIETIPTPPREEKGHSFYNSEYDQLEEKLPYTQSSVILKPEDKMDKLSLPHMTDYLRLAIAFSAELAEPIE